jgi:hypothetical protein
MGDFSGQRGGRFGDFHDIEGFNPVSPLGNFHGVPFIFSTF